MTDDLDELRQQHPGWEFGTVWTSAATGPDYRRLWAQQGSILITGANAAKVRAAIACEARAMAPPA